ncbi:MAG: CRISPR-associated endonuclease Cas2 [Saprospiraceae bacterium]|nr:CRISPR-associated endonuclease Cas2 [Saprospiraceae bacterium]
MYTWVIYDIRKNNTRGRVAKRCKYYGLARVQKSVFFGKLKRRWFDVLALEMGEIINRRTDRIFIVPMNKTDYDRLCQSGAPPSIDSSLQHKNSRFI